MSGEGESEDFERAQELARELLEQDEKVKQVTEHAKQAFSACKAAFEYIAEEAVPGEAKDRARELAERSARAAEEVEEAVHTVEVALLVDNFAALGNAAEQLKAANDGSAAAQAADSLFGAAGRLGGMLPPGPWKFYFDFLKEFEQSHFFEHMRYALTKWQDDDMRGVE